MTVAIIGTISTLRGGGHADPSCVHAAAEQIGGQAEGFTFGIPNPAFRPGTEDARDAPSLDIVPTEMHPPRVGLHQHRPGIETQ